MKKSLLRLLRCLDCRSELELLPAKTEGEEITEGSLKCRRCARSYPIVGAIPRFVPAENYAHSFGVQWNEFRQTQLDSHTGLPLSRERFFFSTGWAPEELDGALVLDVGCGAGRFAEVALDCGAEVVARDYSSAVDACWKNLGHRPKLHVLQGDIYGLPFEPGSFDRVYCLGVLQHTPDVAAAFAALPRQVRPGGRLGVDVYPKLLRNLLWSKYWVRPFTKGMAPDRLFRLVKWLVRYLLPVSLAISRVPVIGPKLRFALPVANHAPDWPLSPAQVREWAVLNTFDMLAPAHDHPQTQQTLRRWFENAGLREVRVFRRGHIVGYGRKAGPEAER